jgi:hypothetical protein
VLKNLTVPVFMTHSFESVIGDCSPGMTRDERFRSILREEYRRRRQAPETRFDKQRSMRAT